MMTRVRIWLERLLTLCMPLLDRHTDRIHARMRFDRRIAITSVEVLTERVRTVMAAVHPIRVHHWDELEDKQGA